MGTSLFLVKKGFFPIVVKELEGGEDRVWIIHTLPGINGLWRKSKVGNGLLGNSCLNPIRHIIICLTENICNSKIEQQSLRMTEEHNASFHSKVIGGRDIIEHDVDMSYRSGQRIHMQFMATNLKLVCRDPKSPKYSSLMFLNMNNSEDSKSIFSWP